MGFYSPEYQAANAAVLHDAFVRDHPWWHGLGLPDIPQA
jgi:hypothetical protein